jgi:hypothetical protein
VKIFFFEIGHVGYKVIENFMLISKKQTYLCDKMPPKKAKIKKKWDLAKLENRFLILTFLGAFCHQDNLLF